MKTSSKGKKHLLPFSDLFEIAAKPQISNSKKSEKRKRNGRSSFKLFRVAGWLGGWVANNSMKIMLDQLELSLAKKHFFVLFEFSRKATS